MISMKARNFYANLLFFHICGHWRGFAAPVTATARSAHGREDSRACCESRPTQSEAFHRLGYLQRTQVMIEQVTRLADRQLFDVMHLREDQDRSVKVRVHALVLQSAGMRLQHPSQLQYVSRLRTQCMQHVRCQDTADSAAHYGGSRLDLPSMKVSSMNT